MRFGILSSVRPLIVAIACVSIGSSARAAILTGSLTSPANPAVNLTTAGSLDWVYWNNTANPVTGTPDNGKLGASLIQNATAIAGGGTLRGSGTLTNGSLTFTDGTPPTTTGTITPSGVFNASLNSAGAGVGLIIDLPTVQAYTISLWVSGFQGTGNLTASLTGATTYTNSGVTYGSGTKPLQLYTFNVTPNTEGDDFTVGYTYSPLGTPDVNGHVLIVAAAISPTPIPEPSTFGLAGIGLAACGYWNLRRRRAL